MVNWPGGGDPFNSVYVRSRRKEGVEQKKVEPKKISSLPLMM